MQYSCTPYLPNLNDIVKLKTTTKRPAPCYMHKIGTHFDGSAFVCVAWKRQWNVSKISSFMLDEREEKAKKTKSWAIKHDWRWIRFCFVCASVVEGEGKLRIAHCIGITENPEIESICFLGYYCWNITTEDTTSERTKCNEILYTIVTTTKKYFTPEIIRLADVGTVSPCSFSTKTKMRSALVCWH